MKSVKALLVLQTGNPRRRFRGRPRSCGRIIRKCQGISGRTNRAGPRSGDGRAQIKHSGGPRRPPSARMMDGPLIRFRIAISCISFSARHPRMSTEYPRTCLLIYARPADPSSPVGSFSELVMLLRNYARS
ncbi:hypothetical protein EVAR_90585_1 [Eumeta japonica]|uniref:Uncharacterized protein n=1 Tax=Eumeta variegata TaxID=151549 RepID=A0A4C2A370_EUMVA|nr:hypothetical protein EVAR_90585_1 [Eumeta japonica]